MAANSLPGVDNMTAIQGIIVAVMIILRNPALICIIGNFEKIVT